MKTFHLIMFMVVLAGCFKNETKPISSKIGEVKAFSASDALVEALRALPHDKIERLEKYTIQIKNGGHGKWRVEFTNSVPIAAVDDGFYVVIDRQSGGAIYYEGE